MDRAELLSDFIQRQTINVHNTEKDGFILCFPNGFRSKSTVQNVCEEKLKNGLLEGIGECRGD